MIISKSGESPEIKVLVPLILNLGNPLVAMVGNTASFLAKQTHAPNMTILFELGVIDPQPIDQGVGLADPRVWYDANVLSSFVDILGEVLHRGRVDVGFLGGLEVDQFGNLNTSLVGDPKGRFRHMIGSGGANDIASCAKRTIIIMRHEERKLKKAISFITSPGYLTGGDSRSKAGLAGGPSRVITDKAIFSFHPETKQMMLASIHPGITLAEVLATMGFLPVVPEILPNTEPPTQEQVRLIREVIDPKHMYMG